MVPCVVSAVKLGASELMRRDIVVPRVVSWKLKDAGAFKPHYISRDRISTGQQPVKRGQAGSGGDYAIASGRDYALARYLRPDKISGMAASARKLSMVQLSMVQVDVFTDRALTGNALAVFLDGRGLSSEQMQALARETNLSETTFILPGDAATEKSRGVRVRIFTVEEELPFAGHPTLGTAFVLRGQPGASEVRLDLNVGTVPVRFTQETSQPVFGEMTQKDPEFGAIHNPGTSRVSQA